MLQLGLPQLCISVWPMIVIKVRKSCGTREFLHKSFLLVHGEETNRNTSSFPQEIVIHSPRADHEIYYYQLLTKKRGSPLWNPGPGMQLPIQYRVRGISIGDVGIITDTGDFDFLFNIFQPVDNPINGRGVPESFSPLDRRQLEIRTNPNFGRNTYLTTSAVRTAGINSS